jgi:hypothetical protein
LKRGLEGLVVDNAVTHIAALVRTIGRQAHLAVGYLNFLSGKGRKIARGHSRAALLEEYPLVQVVVIQLLLVKSVQLLVVYG